MIRPFTVRLFCWLMFLGIGAEFVAVMAFWDRIQQPYSSLLLAEAAVVLAATLGLWMMRRWGFFLLLFLFALSTGVNIVIQLQSQNAEWRIVAFRIIWLLAFLILILPAWSEMLPKKKT
ncbi:MAG: hypothetical protein HZA50_03395 [Planctomycetes bacterium]|nr:hypothetical protein [Planctomycetota bacterium]